MTGNVAQKVRNGLYGIDALNGTGMFPRHSYRSVGFGVETMPAGSRRARHRHLEGYATVVLAGRFTEASFAGLRNAGPGDVLLHGSFDCHANQPLNNKPFQILRLPWRRGSLEGHFHLRDVDALARLAERDPYEAMRVLEHDARPASARPVDWMADLAHDLANSEHLVLRDWAGRMGLRPEALSRGFRAQFGTSPKAFRLESRTRRAWRSVVETNVSLTAIAHEHGFFDLAHMSRSIRAFTGRWPMEWRKISPGSPIRTSMLS